VRRPLFEVKMPDMVRHRLPQDTNGRFSLTAVFAMGTAAQRAVWPSYAA
jgi:hypothetical protein